MTKRGRRGWLKLSAFECVETLPGSGGNQKALKKKTEADASVFSIATND